MLRGTFYLPLIISVDELPLGTSSTAHFLPHSTGKHKQLGIAGNVRVQPC
jgi:hypothetical protein